MAEMGKVVSCVMSVLNTGPKSRAGNSLNGSFVCPIVAYLRHGCVVVWETQTDFDKAIITTRKKKRPLCIGGRRASNTIAGIVRTL